MTRFRPRYLTPDLNSSVLWSRFQKEEIGESDVLAEHSGAIGTSHGLAGLDGSCGVELTSRVKELHSNMFTPSISGHLHSANLNHPARPMVASLSCTHPITNTPGRLTCRTRIESHSKALYMSPYSPYLRESIPSRRLSPSLTLSTFHLQSSYPSIDNVPCTDRDPGL